MHRDRRDSLVAEDVALAAKENAHSDMVLTSEGGDRHLGGGANWALLGPKHKLRA